MRLVLLLTNPLHKGEELAVVVLQLHVVAYFGDIVSCVVGAVKADF